MTADRDSDSTCSCFEREDLRTPDPWDNVNSGAKYQHVEVEKCDGSVRSRRGPDAQELCIKSAINAQV